MDDEKVMIIALEIIIILLSYRALLWVFNTTFHELAPVPGPWLWAASRLPLAVSTIRGRVHLDVARLHKAYGPVIRISPDTVVFNDGAAWSEIFNSRPGKPAFPKDHIRHTRELWINGAPDIFTAEVSQHPRLRRSMAPCFSATSIRAQEHIIADIISLLIQRMSETIKHEGGLAEIDMNQWMNWCTFDLIGDLAFGETFDCLAKGGYHPWVAMICSSIKAVAILGTVKQWKWVETLWNIFINDMWMHAMRRFHRLVIEKVDRRLLIDTSRRDFMAFLLKDTEDQQGLTRDEIYSNSALLIMAGSETSATALSGTFFHLAADESILSALQKDLRSQFNSERGITLETIAKVPLIMAVLRESIRKYPPVPVFNPRRVPKGGARIMEFWLPENTTVGIYHWVLYNSDRHFRNPEKFAPSRWTGDPYYKEDARSVFKPFSTGPRDCIGKSLAYAEMQLILARMLWRFDFELVYKEKNWTHQKSYWAWARVPLMMKITDTQCE